MQLHDAELAICILYLFGKANEFEKLKTSVKGGWEGTPCRSEQLGLLIMYKLFLKP